MYITNRVYIFLPLIVISALSCSVFAVNPPEISASSELIVKGISTLTIKAENDCQIWYNINGEVPSEINEHLVASSSTLVIDDFDQFDDYDEYKISAVAVDSNGNISNPAKATFEVRDAKFNSIETLYNTFNASKQTYADRYKFNGIIKGPLLVTAVGQVYEKRDSKKDPNWIIIYDQKSSADYGGMIVELPSDTPIPDYIKAGCVLDYIEMQFGLMSGTKTDSKVSPWFHSMLFSTFISAPGNSAEGEIEYQQHGVDYAGASFSYYLTPYLFKNVEVKGDYIRGEGLKETEEGYFRYACKFKDLQYDLIEGRRYDIYGLVGEEDEYAIYVLNVIDVTEPEYVSVASIAEAFTDDERKSVVFDCILTVIAVNAEGTHLFVKDANGNHMTILGNFDGEHINPGDKIKGITAEAWSNNGIYYCETAENIDAFEMGEAPKPYKVAAEELGNHMGCYVYVNTTLSVAVGQSVLSRSVALPEITIGSTDVKVNPYAINEGVGDSFVEVAANSDTTKKYKLSGIVSLDRQAQTEFWPTAVEEIKPGTTTGIKELQSDDKEAELYDLYGRQIEKSSATTPGLYILRSATTTQKIYIR